MITVVVVGQTPPPFGGQAIMIQRLLAGTYTNVKLLHVRMAFSRDLDSAGKFKPAKLFELVRVLVNIAMSRIVNRAQVLYYPPAGPNLVPVFRDMFLLGLTRWMFPRTVFHFHAGGVSQIYERLPALLRVLFRLAYSRPDVAIRVTGRAPQDAKLLRAKCEFVVPNGIEDCAASLVRPKKSGTRLVRILFVGVLREDKGVLVLIRACSLLREAGLQFHLVCVGTFESKEFRTAVMESVRVNGLSDYVEFPGVLVGDAKHKAYLTADIFCFPSFFEAETFGLVLVEALSFALPVVCTDWRGFPDVVDDHCALFVPIRDHCSLAVQLKILMEDPERRREMGIAGRKRFLERFTAERFVIHMQDVFDHLAAGLVHQ
jgi:glycosyltransferase involved in cell wall biosynthesis